MSGPQFHMSASEPAAGAGRFPFLGLIVLVLAVLLSNLAQLPSILGQRRALQQSRKSAAELVPQARVLLGQVEPRLEAFSIDLLQMANTNENARALVTQYRMTWTPSAGAAKPGPVGAVAAPNRPGPAK